MIYEAYIPVGIFAVVGIMFSFILLLVSRVIRPTKVEGEKYITYECSIPPIGDAWIQHDVQYYMFALLFAVFDVEAVFLYPWAVVFPHIGMLAVIEMIVFIIVLVVGLAYAWKKEALKWML
jgi:NADH-quinone oxidoreductase subunit A